MLGWYTQRAKCVRLALLSLLLFAVPAAAKIVVDFDPGVEFSKFKTFAYIGGVDSLVTMQINPDLIKNRVTATSTRTGSLQIDLIDPHQKSLDWRLYIIEKITNSDK